jgi:hypothetical protein
MKSRPKRVFTPADNIERLIRAAVERGTVHHMLFDDPDSVTSRGMNRALGALLSLPLTKRLLAVDQIKSTFVRTIVSGAKKQMAADAARPEGPMDTGGNGETPSVGDDAALETSPGPSTARSGTVSPQL